MWPLRQDSGRLHSVLDHGAAIMDRQLNQDPLSDKDRAPAPPPSGIRRLRPRSDDEYDGQIVFCEPLLVRQAGNIAPFQLDDLSYRVDSILGRVNAPPVSIKPAASARKPARRIGLADLIMALVVLAIIALALLVHFG